MDGTSPVGKDMSGLGNDWTPVNFGSSNSIDKATGALPILNTTNGGNTATVGTRPVDEGYPNTGINDGTVWSTATVSGDGSIDGSYPVANAFNGYLTGNNMRSSGTNTNITLTLPKSIPFTSSIRIYHNQNGTAKINSESTVSLTGGGANWVTVYSGSGTFSSLTLTSTSGDTISLFAVEVDGEILVDGHGLVLALPLVGSSDDVSNQINSASSTKTVTASGNAAASSDKSNFYGGSFEFDGSGDYLNTGYSVDSTFAQGNYTIEFWFYSEDDQNEKGLFGLTGNQYGIGMRHFGSYSSGGNKTLSAYFDGTTKRIEITNRVQDRWIHVAMVKNGSTGTFYVDGESQGTVSIGTPTVTTSNFHIGTYYAAGSYGFDGYIQDFRVYTTAKYTSDFIPTRTDPTILPDTPSGVSGKSKLTKIPDGAGAVKFDGTADYLQIADSADFDMGTGDFTLECYVNSEDNNDYQGVFGSYDYDAALVIMQIKNDGVLRFTNGDGSIDQSGTTNLHGTGWHHIAMCRSGTTLRGFVDGKQEISTTYSSSIDWGHSDNSVVIGAVDREDYPNDYHFQGQISNLRLVKGTALYTSDFTPSKSPLTIVTNTKLLCCQSTTQAGAGSTTPNMGGVNSGTQWSAFLTRNDTSKSWYRETSMFNGAIDDLSTTVEKGFYFEPPSPITGITSLRINFESPSDGYRFTLNDNTQKTGSGTISRQWIDLSTEISTEGGTLSKINFERPGSGGNTYPYVFAVEVNGVNLVDPLTPNGDVVATPFNPFNTDINTVRGQETGYATWSPLVAQRSGGNTLSDGNLRTTNSGTRTTTMSDFPLTGKTYWEIVFNSGTYNYYGMTRQDGFNTLANDNSGIKYTGYKDYSYGHQQTDGKFYNASNIIASPGTYANGDVMGWAFDADNYVVKLYKNGVLILTYTNITAGQYYPSMTHSGSATADTNFGQKPFKFPPPEGYQSLNLANVRPETVIARPDQYVGVTTYTGSITDTSSQTVTGINFQSDFVWIKRRGSNSHQLVDSVRGAGKWIESNSTNTEDSTNTNGVLTSLNSNGFTLTGGSTNANLCCESGFDYVGWCWKAGGNKNTFNVDDIGYASAAAAGLTAGDTTVAGASVGTKQGFSIIKYTGPNDTNNHEVPHGLSQAPDFIITKNLDDTYNYDIYHSSLDDDEYMIFTTATTRAQGFNGRPTSTVFKTEHDYSTDENDDYIAYCWHNVPGLQKFGKYSGSGVDDGSFIECGFKPALLWVKSDSTTGQEWIVYDSERGPINVINKYLELQSNNVEQTGRSVDFLSNGFKFRDGTSGATDKNDRTYIFCAWAEAPSIGLYGSQSTAR
jgi:hypothetical protein